MKLMGFDMTDIEGICFGIAHMAMQAIVANDLATFNDRLKLLLSYWSTAPNNNSFLLQLKITRQKYRLLRKQAKEDAAREMIILYKDAKPAIKIKNNELNESQLTQEQKDKYQQLINQNFEHKLKSIPIDEKKLMDLFWELPIFFQGVLMYQQGYHNPEYFETDKTPTNQNALLAIPLLTPIALDKANGIERISSFTGIYNKNDLHLYFERLKNKIIQQKQSQSSEKIHPCAALTLTKADHAVCVNYDPNRNQWVFVDANLDETNLPVRFYNNIEDVVEAVRKGFFSKNEDDSISYNTDVYVGPNYSTEERQFITNWSQEQKAYNTNIDNMDNKACELDTDRTPWLYMAASRGDIDSVNALVENPHTDLEYQEINNENQTALFSAVSFGHSEIVDILLKHGANPNTTRKDDITPLYMAVHDNNLEIVKLLLKAKNIDPNYSLSSLYMAVTKGNINIVKELLACPKLDPNKTYHLNDQDYSPLYLAVSEGTVEIVEVLLQAKNINPNQATSTVPCPLYVAVKNGNLEMVKHLLKHPRINPNQAFSSESLTPLFMAAKNGHTEIVKTLLAHNRVRVHHSFNNNGESPLLVAAENGHSEIVRILLENNKINPNESRVDKTTPLYIAAKNGRTKVVKELLAHPSLRAHQSYKNDESPIFAAAENGHTEIVKMLLENNQINPNDGRDDGATPLYMAAKNGHVEIMKLLLAQPNIDVNRVCMTDYMTPIKMAMKNGHGEIVQLLLDILSPIALSTLIKAPSSGDDLLYIAIKNKQTKIVEKLLAKGFDVNKLCGGASESPLSVAISTNHYEMVKLLMDNKANAEKINILTIAKSPDHNNIVKLLRRSTKLSHNTKSKSLSSLSKHGLSFISTEAEATRSTANSPEFTSPRSVSR